MSLRRLSCANRRSALVMVSAGVLYLATSACDQPAPSRRSDSGVATPVSAAGGVAPPIDRSGWDAAAGPALLVQGSTIDEAIAIFPFADDTLDQAHLDSASTNGGGAALFGRGGVRFAARLGALPDETESTCERWLLRDVVPQGSGRSWAVGFVDGRVAPMVLDSMGTLTLRDSTALAAEASRLASTVASSPDQAFQGLRFTAHDIRRFQAGPGIDAFVAHLVRHVNQEANPREEQTLLIAERAHGARSPAYHLTYAERTAGREEAVVTPEVLAALRVGESIRPTLVVARESETGVVYLFLERTDAGSWRVRWTSPPSHCS